MGVAVAGEDGSSEGDIYSARHDVDEEAILAQMDRCFRLIHHQAPSSLLGQLLSRELYEELRLRYTRLDNTLLDLLRPVGKDLGHGKNRVLTDPNFTGITIPDVESFKVFAGLVEPIIKEISGTNVLNSPSESDFTGGEPEAYFNINIDPGGAIVKSCVVEIVRNLSIVPFSKNLKLSELEKVEVALSSVLTAYYRRNKDDTFIDEAGENLGSYYSLGEVLENKELFQDLKEEGLLVEGVETGTWPYGRGVFISPYGDVTGWVNIREHVHLLSATPADRRGDIGNAYRTVAGMVALLEERVESARFPGLGLLATEPGLVGNCLRFHVLASFPHVGEDLPALRKLACSKGLIIEANPSPGVFRLRNRSCQGSTEVQTFKAFVAAISDIIDMEKEFMKMTVSQIPNMIKKFLRKRSSKNLLAEINK